MNLVRGDTVSAPRPLDLIPEEPPRIVQLVLGGRVTSLEVSLTRPEPPRSRRARALALDVDVVCQRARRSEEHTSELQSQSNLVCRLLLEKKKTQHITLNRRTDSSATVTLSQPGITLHRLRAPSLGRTPLSSFRLESSFTSVTACPTPLMI